MAIFLINRKHSEVYSGIDWFLLGFWLKLRKFQRNAEEKGELRCDVWMYIKRQGERIEHRSNQNKAGRTVL